MAPTTPKPPELLEIQEHAAELFALFRQWFAVPERVELNLASVDIGGDELREPGMVAALAMRKLQALRLVSTPGQPTSNDQVVAIVADLGEAVRRAPDRWLERLGHEGQRPADAAEQIARFRWLADRLDNAGRVVAALSGNGLIDLR